MATFTDSIKLTIDVVTGNAKSGISNLKSEVKQAEGGWNKFKTAGSGALDVVGKNAALLATGAGAALVAFGAKSISAFQDMALSAGDLRDKLGLTAEEASRLQEVAGDLGIPIQAVETAVGRMNKVVGSSPATFQQLGIEIARTKDGAYDANGTFLNVIDALHGMPDAAARAAAGAQIFGKGWTQVSELVAMGADKVKDRLAAVEDQKIATDAQIDSAKEFRDALDNLHDAAEDLSLTVGRTLLPVLSQVADLGAKIAGPIAAAADKLGDFKAAAAETAEAGTESGASFWEGFKGGFAAAADAKTWGKFVRETLGIDKAGQIDVTVAPNLVGGATEATEEYTAALDAQGDKLLESKQAMGAAKSAQESYEKAVEGVNEALQKQSDALNEQIDAAQAAADSSIALADSNAELGDATATTHAAWVALTDAVKKHGEGSKEATEAAVAQNEAILAERDAIIDAAKASQRYAEDQAAAAGSTLTATQKVDGMNASLEQAASSATPAARRAAYEYLVQLNQIPAEKASEILALVDQGLLDQANAEMANASKTRQAAINVDAIGVSQANSEIDHAARDRDTVINVRYNADLGPIGGTNRRAAGGPVMAGQAYIVGDKFGVNSPSAEVFVPNTSGKIYPNVDTASMTPAGLSGAGVNLVVNVAVGHGTNPVAAGQEVGKVFMAWLNTGGAGPVRKALGIKSVGTAA